MRPRTFNTSDIIPTCTNGRLTLAVLGNQCATDNIVYDSSGSGRHGVLGSGARWVYDGQLQRYVMQLSGSATSYATMPIFGMPVEGNVLLWVKPKVDVGAGSPHLNYFGIQKNVSGVWWTFDVCTVNGSFYVGWHNGVESRVIKTIPAHFQRDKWNSISVAWGRIGVPTASESYVDLCVNSEWQHYRYVGYYPGAWWDTTTATNCIIGSSYAMDVADVIIGQGPKTTGFHAPQYHSPSFEIIRERRRYLLKPLVTRSSVSDAEACHGSVGGSVASQLTVTRPSAQISASVAGSVTTSSVSRPVSVVASATGGSVASADIGKLGETVLGGVGRSTVSATAGKPATASQASAAGSVVSAVVTKPASVVGWSCGSSLAATIATRPAVSVASAIASTVVTTAASRFAVGVSGSVSQSIVEASVATGQPVGAMASAATRGLSGSQASATATRPVACVSVARSCSVGATVATRPVSGIGGARSASSGGCSAFRPARAVAACGGQSVVGATRSTRAASVSGARGASVNQTHRTCPAVAVSTASWRSVAMVASGARAPRRWGIRSGGDVSAGIRFGGAL